MQFRVDAEQGFLEGVLGVQGILQDPVDAGGEEPHVGFYQLGKSLSVPLEGLGDELGFGFLVHSGLIDYLARPRACASLAHVHPSRQADGEACAQAGSQAGSADIAPVALDDLLAEKEP